MTAQTIRLHLQAAFEPERLDLIDDSSLHAGHAGNTGGGHYRIHIVSRRFAGMSRLNRQRAVQQALQDLYPAQIHALSIRAQTPAEYDPENPL